MSDNNSNNTLSEIEFSSLDLFPAVREGLNRAGFTHCTPIQALTLPSALKGNDVAGQAHAHW
jgi:ATP-dependent RNA helicase RhlB